MVCDKVFKVSETSILVDQPFIRDSEKQYTVRSQDSDKRLYSHYGVFAVLQKMASNNKICGTIINCVEALAVIYDIDIN
jgi:hypothetical protein